MGQKFGFNQNVNKESKFNTAWAKMERIAETQKRGNEFQFNRDYINWAKTIEILYKEVYSKCTLNEEKEAETTISKMNNKINLFNMRKIKNNSVVEEDVFKACWEADKLMHKLMERHKLGSPDEDSPYNAAYDE